MERAIIHSDLTKNEIQPQHLLDQYIELLQNDIKSIFPVSVLESASCPVTGEETVRNSFDKMGLEYQVSQTLGNIYLSPRPSKEKLIEFVNLVNECCAVMDDDYVAEWLTTPNSDLNMEPPIQLVNDEVGREKILRLLYFIDIGEADL